MSTFSHSLQPIRIRHLSLVPKDVRVEAEFSIEDSLAPADDGLGCVRGIAVAMVCNLIFALMVAAGWGLWHFLR